MTSFSPNHIIISAYTSGRSLSRLIWSSFEVKVFVVSDPEEIFSLSFFPEWHLSTTHEIKFFNVSKKKTTPSWGKRFQN